MRRNLAAAIVGLVFIVCVSAMAAAQLPPDDDWRANAVLRNVARRTDKSLGACQGVSLHKNRLYFYGDCHHLDPRVGIIVEYGLDLKPTGKKILLTKNGQPLIVHPTGLTWDVDFGCFLGDTVNQKATIYRLDFERALADGNLDAAVRDVLRDDAATNGCRPEFVTVAGRRLLATADYGDVKPEIRLYDPHKLLKAGLSSGPDVIVRRIPCGPFNQNLAWNADDKTLICIQNVVAGRGWRLDVLSFENGLEPDFTVRKARVQQLTFNPHDELEGYRPLPDGRAVFTTAWPKHNITVGEIKTVEPFRSPRGSMQPNPASE